MKKKLSACGSVFFTASIIILMVCISCLVLNFQSVAFVMACIGIPLMLLSWLVLLASMCISEENPTVLDKCKCGEYKYECKCYEDFFK